jgi:hypothetical protein
MSDGGPVVVSSDDVPPTPEDAETFWDELMKFAGKAQGLPSDMAERHDHYRRERHAIRHGHSLIARHSS